MAVIDDVKALLGDIDGKDDLLYVIIKLTENRLKLLLNVENVPSGLEYIITEVSLSRFNRIGSEGLSSHTVEGESLSFNDNDFDAFGDDIATWRNAQESETNGRWRIL